MANPKPNRELHRQPTGTLRLSGATQGEFYVGVDFGKEQDFSVVLVVEKQGSMLRVVHVHRFPFHTEYASVIGYVKSLQDRWRTIRAFTLT